VIKALFLLLGELSSERRLKVEKEYFFKGIILAIFFALFISPLTFASDESIVIVRIQGPVMDLDSKNNVIIVNERTFVLSPNTGFYDGKGSPVSIDKLKKKTWVYVEGVRENAKKRVVAEKIYLLPKYIHGKEKHLYPFIQ
jgi:hypothetical protein